MDAVILARRTVTKMVRNPEQFIDVTLQPVLMTVIFVFIFGGAIAGGTEQYLLFTLPAIIVQTIMFTSMTIGVNLNTDLKNGVFDRFRSLPISRSAPSSVRCSATSCGMRSRSASASRSAPSSASGSTPRRSRCCWPSRS
ncbi:hypothetical protein GCM10025869_35090 [Homoserinibacter gongjuensis]|uniref:ABC-2 type transporter transmembrane domain-containing protein n=1 Tax=Homoserinibacter gongjuensis TaxID=1162968 RepID=A0ABQ6K1N3_9MICO|nr:hypothetical protein GCM10025869_35090 [Homoserinibacter gongjuensis]